MVKECKNCNCSCTLGRIYKLIIKNGEYNKPHIFNFCSVECLKEYVNGMV